MPKFTYHFVETVRFYKEATIEAATQEDADLIYDTGSYDETVLFDEFEDSRLISVKKED